MTAFVRTPVPRIIPLAPEEIPPTFAEAGGAWLVNRAIRILDTNERGNVLIHADDGVLWARVGDGRLVTPPAGDDVPQLRTPTVQQCRLFGAKGELFIWREDEGVWRGRELLEEATQYATLEEEQLLYGNQVRTTYDGFTTIYEEGVGMHQVVPLLLTSDDFAQGQRLSLTVCHYLSEDEDGQARIVCSRLKALTLRRLP